jgi:tRNA threonylcarbamoyladenosine biosynthesis protein TsaB
VIGLGLNTIGETCDAALVVDGEEALVRRRDLASGADAVLAPMVRDLLADAGVTPREIGLIAVIVGPGSFTGLRVGVAFARGFSLACGADVAGVTAFEALCLSPPAGEGIGILPAKRRPPDLSWWIQHLRDGVGVGEVMEVGPVAMAELDRSQPLWIGDGISWAGCPPERLQPQAPSAAAAIGFALRQPAGRRRPALPLYGRLPDAVPMSRS